MQESNAAKMFQPSSGISWRIKFVWFLQNFVSLPQCHIGY